MQLSHCTERIEESLFNDYWFACLTFNDNVWVDKLESIDTAPLYKDIINLCCFSILNSWVASALWASVFSCLFCKAVTAIKVKMIISIRVTLSISYIFSPKTILKWLFFVYSGSVTWYGFEQYAISIDNVIFSDLIESYPGQSLSLKSVKNNLILPQQEASLI